MFFPKSAAGPLKAVDMPRTISPVFFGSLANRMVGQTRKEIIIMHRRIHGKS
jgi:hypothetical protein